MKANAIALRLALLFFGAVWAAFAPGYFDPTTDLSKFLAAMGDSGRDPTTTEVMLYQGGSGYCLFWSLTDLALGLLSSDRRSMQLVLCVQVIMCAFFLLYHVVSSPALGFVGDLAIAFRLTWLVCFLVGASLLAWDHLSELQNRNSKKA